MSVMIRWNTAKKCGTIRKLNGGNLGPSLAGEMSGCNYRKSYAEMNLAFARMHDAPLGNANCPMVDISSIFPLFHLDENDPRNYRFQHTDDYFHNTIVDAKTPVFYRLGESIDHTVNKYFIDPPKDVDKWINICSNIIRHYTEGLWNGFNYDIQYWEIWNEPECLGNTRLDPNAKNLMWLGTLQEFNVFYVQVATTLKKRFPHLKFGGPSHCGFSEKITGEFLEYCAQHNAPLDFYSYHCYTGDPYGWIQESPGQVRKMLDKFGYCNAEIHLNEWHYFPGDWHRLRNDSIYKRYMYGEEMRGLNSAAFLCTVMALWQDTPLDYGAYYTVNNSAWGCYVQNSNAPTPSYYGLKAFGEIVKFPVRLEVASDSPNVTVLAGEQQTGRKALLISAFNTSSTEFVVEADVPLCRENSKVLLLDEDHLLAECRNTVFENNLLKFQNRSNSAVAIILING